MNTTLIRCLTRSLLASCAVAGTLLGVGAGNATAAPARTAPYVPGEVIVGYRPPPAPSPRAITADLQRNLGVRTLPAAPLASPTERILRLRRGQSVPGALAQLRRQAGVAYAVPDYIAHTAGTSPATPAWYPNDPGRSHTPKGWEAMQWNFLPGTGVNAPQAWANLLADHRPGGRGVTLAILDTGVAYRHWRNFRESPDFVGTRFVKPYDFVAGNRYPLDHDGHGTFVAGIVAEATNNGFGLTGLAYGASVMPVRVLGADGTGDAATIARGIRYAATRGAQVINLSLEFSLDVTPQDIPDIFSAIRFAHRRGVIVVAASGNEGVQQVAYPAAAPDVISVGASTKDRCLANYSNVGAHLDLVAPGGNDDTSLLDDPNCHYARALPDISQMTFFDPAKPGRFGFPGGWYGTSMAAPHVAAAAALVIASGVLGPHPSPEAVRNRLETTAQPLGRGQPNQYYGHGLVNAGAATAPVSAVATRRR
ncbi:MAG: S8 family serine peptidase [Actinomycetota bacterium]|nr:S8 family serine peptidase [Actinomycetota bacterium]